MEHSSICLRRDRNGRFCKRKTITYSAEIDIQLCYVSTGGNYKAAGVVEIVQNSKVLMNLQIPYCILHVFPKSVKHSEPDLIFIC